MKKLLLLLFLIPNLVMAETWECEQKYPNVEAPIYKFERSGDNFITSNSATKTETKFNIIHENKNYIITVNKKFFKIGFMPVVTLSKKDNSWIMNNHSPDFNGEWPNTKWSGTCLIVK